MNVMVSCVRMVELVEMVSIPSSVSAQKATLGKIVKATLTNADQIPAWMEEHVKILATFIIVLVPMAIMETIVKTATI